MSNTSDSWPKVVANALLIPVVLIGLSTYLIPGIVAEASKQEALRTARLKKSLEIGAHDMDFRSRLNVLKTRMDTFHKQNLRGKLSPSELKEARKMFQKEYTDEYLALDKMAWWWYWDLEREAEVFDLLSSDDTKKLLEFIREYAANVERCVGSIDPVWSYLSSADYKLDQGSQNHFVALTTQMNSDLIALNDQRVVLVKNISALFAHSQYEPKDN